jgi:hypothetical protein
MKNFKSSVPALVQDKLHVLATNIQLAFSDVVTHRCEAYGDVQLSEIEGNYVSGWMPRQDGGFNVSLLVVSDLDSSYHITEKQTEFVNEQSKNCMQAFCMDNSLDEDAEMSDETRDEYYEYERDWFADGALIQIQMYASGYPGSYWEEKEQTITVRVSVNYKDAPYFRERDAEDVKTLILSEAEFMAMCIKDIITQITI